MLYQDNEKELGTIFIKEEISKCEDIADLREKIFPMLKTQESQWAKKINEIIAESGLSKSRFAEICNVSRVAVNKWCNGSIPKNRETFLRIGMAAGYGRDKMDQLLQRYGQYPGLYAKSLEDCVCIFVLEKGYGAETLTKYKYILDKIKENIISDDILLREDKASDKGTASYNDDVDSDDMSTVIFDEKISDIKNETELERFIADNSLTFSTTYRRFYAYVNMNITANYESFGGTVFELAEGQGWSSSLRQCVSAIRQKKWYPTRNKIISLGLHLSMDHEQIDEMLELAHMEPLCAKNIFESVIMFILEDASLSNMLDTESDEYDPDELCRYARKVMEELDLDEVGSFITELPEIDDED